jgi:hypothetical protein
MCIRTENTNCAAASHENTPGSNVLPSEGVLDGRREKTNRTGKHGGLHRRRDRILRVIVVTLIVRGHGGGLWQELSAGLP